MVARLAYCLYTGQNEYGYPRFLSNNTARKILIFGTSIVKDEMTSLANKSVIYSRYTETKSLSSFALYNTLACTDKRGWTRTHSRSHTHTRLIWLRCRTRHSSGAWWVRCEITGLTALLSCFSPFAHDTRLYATPSERGSWDTSWRIQSLLLFTSQGTFLGREQKSQVRHMISLVQSPFCLRGSQGRRGHRSEEGTWPRDNAPDWSQLQRWPCLLATSFFVTSNRFQTTHLKSFRGHALFSVSIRRGNGVWEGRYVELY